MLTDEHENSRYQTRKKYHSKRRSDRHFGEASCGDERGNTSHLKFTINLPPNLELQDIEASVRSSGINITKLGQFSGRNEVDSDIIDVGDKICILECYQVISQRLFNKLIHITCQDRIGLLADITGCLFKQEIDIVNINSHVNDNENFVIGLTLSRDLQTNWQYLFRQIENVTGVKSITFAE